MLATGEGGEEGDGDGDGDGAEGKPGSKRRKAASADPSSTLAATWEELNAKKFDLAFAVDPLFHKTSAQFDEGGARGALHQQPFHYMAQRRFDYVGSERATQRKFPHRPQLTIKPPRRADPHAQCPQAIALLLDGGPVMCLVRGGYDILQERSCAQVCC